MYYSKEELEAIDGENREKLEDDLLARENEDHSCPDCGDMYCVGMCEEDFWGVFI